MGASSFDTEAWLRGLASSLPRPNSMVMVVVPDTRLQASETAFLEENHGKRQFSLLMIQAARRQVVGIAG